MSVGAVNKDTGDRIPTAGMPAIDDALDLTSVNPVQNAIITAALANKQDKTDNSLQTTNKTVVGAVNELKSGLSGIKSVSETITLGAILAGNLAQITINGVSTTPKAIYIKDNSKGFPIIAANFWVSNNVLTIQAYNVSVSDRTEGDIECVLIYC